MSDDPKSGDYPVGYGKPPVHGQFKKGQSGNPSGKKKAEPTLAELVALEGLKLTKVKIDGVPKTITRRQALATQLYQSALSRDARAQKMVLELENRAEAAGEAPDEKPLTQGEFDQMMAMLKDNADD